MHFFRDNDSVAKAAQAGSSCAAKRPMHFFSLRANYERDGRRAAGSISTYLFWRPPKMEAH